MTSRRIFSILGIGIWTAVALTAAPHALPHRHASPRPAQTEAPAAACSDMHLRFDDHDAVVKSEERSITKAEAPTLRVLAESNGGIQVDGWDEDTYAVTLCKAAEAGSDADALLSKIHLTFQNGELGVAGPTFHRRWAAHLLIRAPKAAALELHVNNGPLSVSNVNGNLNVRAENGPVTITGCSGELSLTSHNGPVSLEGNSGKQSIRTENGPVTVTLAGDSWNGSGLEAHAQNGPVNLQIPSGYKSGVVLESEGHSPFQCHASVCSEGRKTWDDDLKRIEFGSGPTLVRVSTVNGPVSVE
jgi:hypothetical protein